MKVLLGAFKFIKKKKKVVECLVFSSVQRSELLSFVDYSRRFSDFNFSKFVKVPAVR